MEDDTGSGNGHDSKPWNTLAVTTMIQALVSMSTLMLPVLSPLIAKEFGSSASLVAGSVAALTYLGAAVFSVIGGPFIYRLGAIRLTQISMLACAVGLAIGSSGFYWALLLGAFLIGAGNGPITPASSHILSRTTSPSRLSLVFSIKQTGVPLGGLAAGAIGPPLGVLTSWQVVLTLLGLLCAGCALFAQPLRRRIDTDIQPKMPIHIGAMLEPARMVMTHPDLRRLALCSMAFVLAQLSITAYSVTYLSEGLGMGIVAAGLFLSIAQAGGIVGRICWGFAADKWWGGRVTLSALGATMAVCAIAMSTLNTSTPIWALALLMSVYGAAAVGWNGVFLAQIARIAPRGLEGKATGGALMFSFLGSVIGPIALAWAIHALGGLRWTYMLIAIPIAIAALVSYKRPTNAC